MPNKDGVMMKVEGLPEAPGEGLRWANVVRQVSNGEFYWSDGGIKMWDCDIPSIWLYPVVEKIKPRRIVLEQVMDPGDVRIVDINRNQEFRTMRVIEHVIEYDRESAKKGRIFRIIEDGEVKEEEA